MTDILDIFKALADEGRLRILRAIDQAELSVAELVQALEMPQSTVSRHLKPMRESGLVQSRRDGTSVFYNRGPLFKDTAFAQVLTERLRDMSVAHRDRVAIDHVLDRRRRKSRDFFDKMAGQYSCLAEPGGGWQAMAAAFAAGFAGKTVADLGCGEGHLTLLLARFAAKVIAVDQSQKMLEFVKEQAVNQDLDDRVELHQGNVEHLSGIGKELDAVFLSQSLHHTSSPEAVIYEAAQMLKEGGQLIVLDLVRHEHEWTREEWADQWLGFDQLEIGTWLKSAGLNPLVIDSLPSATPDLSVLMVVGEKAAK